MTRPTNAQRAKASERTRIGAGYRSVRVVLSPEAAAALDSLTVDGTTMTGAIEAALLDQVPKWEPLTPRPTPDSL